MNLPAIELIEQPLDQWDVLLAAEGDRAVQDLDATCPGCHHERVVRELFAGLEPHDPTARVDLEDTRLPELRARGGGDVADGEAKHLGSLERNGNRRGPVREHVLRRDDRATDTLLRKLASREHELERGHTASHHDHPSLGAVGAHRSPSDARRGFTIARRASRHPQDG